MFARVLASRGGLLLVLAAGLAMPLAFAPFGWGWIAPLALAVAFAQVAASSRRRALLGAYLFGLGYAGFGVYWIFISVSRYGGGDVAAAVVTPLFIALFALYPLVALALGRRVGAGRPLLTTVVALPAAWILVEWVRSWLFTGATWLSVGYTQIDLPPGALAPVLGLYGAGVVVCALAGALASIAIRPGAGAVVAVVITGGLYAGSGTLAAFDWTAPMGEPLDVAMIQGNVPQDQKWLADQRVETLRHYAQASRQHYGTPLIVWPEAAVPAFYHRVEGNFLAPLAEEAAEQGSTIVTGVPVVDPVEDAPFNAVAVLGDSPAFYYKRHLVPFGEYVPFRDWFGAALDFVGAPMGDFEAGAKPRPLEADGVTIGASVCYEVTFGSLIADALPEAEVLLNVSNDAWFGDSLAPYQHLEMARMRARETGRPLLRATNTGITAAMDARGEVLAQAPMFQRTALATTVQPREGTTPYVRWRDWPVVALVMIALAGAWFAARRRGRDIFH